MSKESSKGDTVSSTNIFTITLPDMLPVLQRLVPNFILIWLDCTVGDSGSLCQNILEQLQHLVNDVHIVTRVEQIVRYISNVKDRKGYLILTSDVSRDILTVIDNIPQIDTIYILCDNDSQREEWTTKSSKISGVHNNIKSLYRALQKTVKQSNQDSMPVSFVPANEDIPITNLNQLEPSFMYTQIFKEILLEMRHDKKSIETFVSFWRQHYITNTLILKVIAEFERDYSAESSIKWYTREYFIYQMLNEALRTLDSHTIINMGFLIHDLHKQIEQLHQQQLCCYRGNIFTVYRGQGLSKVDFNKLQKSEGGLMSFNNFLSTSLKKEVSWGFAIGALGKADNVGILFKMMIDPSISSVPFASIRQVSHFNTEEEILFSMHTVFRIGKITEIDKDSSLYEVDLTLIADDDEQLRTLTRCIREELTDVTEWTRLGSLLTKIGQFRKAEDLYNILLEQASNQREKSLYYNELGLIQNHQGDYKKATEYYEKSLEIRQKTLPPNHPYLAIFYNNIGLVYRDMGEYSKALSFYEKSLEILQKTLPPNHPSLATSYNNIAAVYNDIGEYSKALSFYEKSLEIRQKTLPPNHPDLAYSYNNIGEAYHNMGEYSKALSLCKKSLEILQKTLPPNHPHLAGSYNGLGLVYKQMGEYSKALSFYEKSLEILQKTLPPNHPHLASSYNGLGLVYKHMGEYSKALSLCKKSLEILQKTLPPNHPHLASSYNGLGLVYKDMGEYSKALSFYEKSLEILQKTLPPNHPHLASSYNGLGLVYKHMGEYLKALSLCKKSLEIRQKSLPANYLGLAASYNNIGQVYLEMDQYSKSLEFYEKSLEIRLKILPPNHPDLATSYNNIGEAYHNMEEYSKAFSFYENSVQMRQKTLSPNHPDLAISYNNFGNLYNKTGEYSEALSYLKRALDIKERSLSPNHPSIQNVRRNIENITRKL